MENQENLKLKYIGLKESLLTMVSNYEEKIVDLRVEITLANEEINRLKEELSSLQASVEDEYVEAEIVQE